MHVYKSLSDLPVHRAQEAQGNRELEEQPIDHYKVANGHGTFHYLLGSHHHDCGERSRENEALSKVEESEGPVSFEGGLFILDEGFVILASLVILVVEILDRFKIDQRVNGFVAGLIVSPEDILEYFSKMMLSATDLFMATLN